jgi:Leucine-rich repeat (LRR) protein
MAKRYSLRTLICLVVLLALGCALAGWIHRREAEREYIKAELQARGAQIYLGKIGTPPAGWPGASTQSDADLFVDLSHRGASYSDLDLAKLPRIGDVGTLLLSGNSLITDDGLRHLANLHSLHTLHLNDTNTSDAGLRALGQLKNLEELNVSHTKVHGAGLQHLGGLPNLSDLDLSFSELQGVILDQGFPTLTRLDLSDCTELSEISLSNLRQLEALEAITYGSVLRRVHLQHLPNLRELRIGIVEGADFEIVLDDTPKLHSLFVAAPVGTSLMRQLSAMPELTELQLSRHAVLAKDDLAFLSSCRKLQKLSMADQPISDDDLENLAHVSSLIELDIGGGNIRGPGLKWLAGLRRLNRLVLRGNPLTDEAAVHLQQLTTLQSLDVRGTELTDKGLRILRSATQPRLDE